MSLLPLLHTVHYANEMLFLFVFPVFIITCDFVSNQLAGLNLANAAKEAAELFLGHVLGQVVDDEVGLAVVIRAGLHGRGAAAAVAGGPVGRGGVRPIRHLRLHVADYLQTKEGLKDVASETYAVH